MNVTKISHARSAPAPERSSAASSLVSPSKRIRLERKIYDISSLSGDIVRFLHALLSEGRPEMARRLVAVFRLVSKSWLKMALALPVSPHSITSASPVALLNACRSFRFTDLDLTDWAAGRSGCVPSRMMEFQDLKRLMLPYCNRAIFTWVKQLVLNFNLSAASQFFLIVFCSPG